jgi:hypothetical protein
MGWLDTVLKIALPAGQAVGALGQSMTQNRGMQTAANQQRDALGIQAQNSYQNALLNRAQLELAQKQDQRTAQSDAYQKALRSAVLLNWSPVARPSGVANISFVPNVGSEGRSAAETLNRQAQMALLNGEDLSPLPTIDKYQVTATPQPSTLEKLTNVLGPGLTLAGILGGKLKRPQTPYDFGGTE